MEEILNRNMYRPIKIKFNLQFSHIYFETLVPRFQYLDAAIFQMLAIYQAVLFIPKSGFEKS